MIAEKSLTQNFIILRMERKNTSDIQGRIDMIGLALHPTIKQVIVNLHPKYDYSSLHSCGEIFVEIFHSMNGKK